MGVGLLAEELVPVSLQVLEELLEARVSSKRLAGLVEERGVDFVLTSAVRERLQKNGAEEDLLTALEKSSAQLAIRRAEEERKKFEKARLELEEERRRFDEARRKEEQRQAEIEKRKQYEARLVEEAKRRAAEAKRVRNEQLSRSSPAPGCDTAWQILRWDDGRQFTRITRRGDSGGCEVQRAALVTVYDRDWKLLKIWRTDGQPIPPRRGGSFFVFEEIVGQRWLEFPLEVGKKWQREYQAVNSRGRNVSVSSDLSIVAVEDVTVAGTTYKTFKIRQQITTTSRTGGTRYLWYAPETGYYIKTQIAKEEAAGFWSAEASDIELVTTSGSANAVATQPTAR
jgi:hypothetical protein